MFQQDNKSKGADATSEGRAAIPRDPARLEGWADRDIMTANKDKSQVLPLDSGSPLQWQRLRTAWLVFSSAYKALDCRYPGLYKQEHGQGKSLSPSAQHLSDHIQNVSQVLTSYNAREASINWNQLRGGHQGSQGLRPRSAGRGRGNCACSTLGKGRSWGGNTEQCNCLWGDFQEDIFRQCKTQRQESMRDKRA